MRKRFRPAERAAYTVGTAVEWLNGTHWQPGTIMGPIAERDGWQEIPVENHATTRTIHAGQFVHPGPGHIRPPRTASEGT